MAKTSITNALTINFEDCYQGLEIPYSEWNRFEDRIEMAGDRLLQILDEGNAKATFFMLGYVAEKHPELVKRIEAKRSMDVWGNGFFDNIEEPVGIVKAMKDCTKALR